MTDRYAAADLGAGATIGRDTTEAAIAALWPCPTETQAVAALPGIPGRTILTYRFPEARLEGHFETPGETPAWRRFAGVHFHFDGDGRLIFMEEAEGTDLPVAVGGNLLELRVHRGRGHRRDPACRG